MYIYNYFGLGLGLGWELGWLGRHMWVCIDHLPESANRAAVAYTRRDMISSPNTMF